MLRHQLLKIVIALAITTTISACSGSDSPATVSEAANGSNWDEMKWGEGTWQD